MKNTKIILSIMTLCITSILFGAQTSGKPLKYEGEELLDVSPDGQFAVTRILFHNWHDSHDDLRVRDTKTDKIIFIQPFYIEHQHNAYETYAEAEMIKSAKISSDNKSITVNTDRGTYTIDITKLTHK